jgi:hypothetical protein
MGSTDPVIPQKSVDFSRRSSRIIFVVLLTIGIFLIAGCVTQTHAGNETKTTTMITPLTSAQVTPASCLDNASKEPFILINPINPTHFVSDIFEINGTTNLDPDEIIYFDVAEPVWTTPFNVTPKPFSTSNGLVKIVDGDCGINRWSFFVNLSGFHPNVYFVDVASKKWQVHNMTNFHVFTRV